MSNWRLSNTNSKQASRRSPHYVFSSVCTVCVCILFLWGHRGVWQCSSHATKCEKRWYPTFDYYGYQCPDIAEWRVWKLAKNRSLIRTHTRRAGDLGACTLLITSWMTVWTITSVFLYFYTIYYRVRRKSPSWLSFIYVVYCEFAVLLT